ncbi:MAG: hypothetical protein QME06_02215 [Desulfobacterales bacterium]|nr:hypothetical protein [Desulfobacterales bacterium]
MIKLTTLFLGIILLATPLVFAAEQTPDNAPTQNPAMLLDQTANEIRHILHEMH